MKCIYKIISCSNYAYEIVKKLSSAKVHSVYNRTINLCANDCLLSLQSENSPLSPITLETNCSPEELSIFDLSSGDEISAANDGLYINGNFFLYDFAPCWNCALSSIQQNSCAPNQNFNLSFLYSCLNEMLPIGGFSDLVLPNGEAWKSSASASEAGKILSHCSDNIMMHSWESASAFASNLIGLGEGLTPSGDDFLCGMLAALQTIATEAALNFRFSLSEKLSDALTKTNDISAAFLRSAIEGQFSKAVILLVEGADKQTVVNNFSAIGHSSGADTLSGYIFAAETFSRLNNGGL